MAYLYSLLCLGFLNTFNKNTDLIPNVRLNPEVAYHCLQNSARFLSIRDAYLSPGEAWQRRDEFSKWEDFTISNDEKEIWIYFSIANSTRQPENFYLNGQLTDYVELYQIVDGRPELVTSSGYLMPFEDRPILDWGLIVSSAVPGQSEQKYLFRLKSVTRNSRYLMDYAVTGCMKLYSQSGYENTYKLRRRLTYFFLGVIFVMFIYNLFISISTFYREYFLFSIYNIVTVLACLFITDAHLETGLLRTADWGRNIQYIFFSAIPFSYFLFSIQYLDLRINMPGMYKILKWIPWVYLAILISLVLSYYITAFMLTVVTTTPSFLIMLYCSIRLSAGIPSARFLLAGNVIVSIVGILNLFHLLDWLSTSLTVHASYTLQMIEVVMFSFAVAYKLRVSKRTMHRVRHLNEIQRERLMMEEAMRKQLEIDINQKARSLTTTSIQLLNFNNKLTEILNKIKCDVRSGHHPWEYVIRELDNLKQSEGYWKSIKTHFESVHPDFFAKLERNFPNLTPNDHKLLAFLKMKLSNKEIAIILNVSRRAVEQAKRRVKKKLGMDPHDMDIIGFVEGCPIRSET